MYSTLVSFSVLNSVLFVLSERVKLAADKLIQTVGLNKKNSDLAC